MIQSPWEALQGRLVLGTAEFVKRIKRQLRGNRREQTSLRRMDHRPTVREIIALVEQLKERPWMEFWDEHGDWGRDLALYVGRRRGGLKLKELADAAGGIDYVSVGMAI